MVLGDNDKNTEFFYVYSNNFRWLNPLDIEQFRGHPIDKKVYRAAYNNETKTYRLFVDDPEWKSAIVIPTLKEFEGGYEGELIRVTKDNIIDLKLPEEELDKLAAWLDLDNKDIKEELSFKSAEKKAKPIRIKISQEEIEVTEFINEVSELYRTQYTIFDAVNQFTQYANNRGATESLDEYNLSLSEDFGAGLNVGRAFACLSQYVSDNRRDSLIEEDLMEAIYHLMNEIARRRTHEL